MVNCGYCDRSGLNVDPGADQLLDRTEGTAAEFFRNRISASGILVDHSDQFNRALFAGKLMIDAGMVASECAYADDSNGDGSWIRQWDSEPISD